MKILVFPRDPNPYQDLLYGEMAKLGAEVTYLGQVTASHTCNVLLLPLELAARRLRGARLIHLHWVYAFGFPAARRFPVLRRAAQGWFLAWLRTARWLGMHLVWTAHNVLPHEPVFADDAAARRSLVAASDLVFAHSPTALTSLRALGAVPRRAAVIRHGPFRPRFSTGALRVPAAGGGPRQFLFFGAVHEYKGVEDLLAAVTQLPQTAPVQVTIAGHCGDSELRSSLASLASRAGDRVALRLCRIPEEEVTSLLAAADVMVLPFRRVTTSGSALLALSHGRPLIVPDLATLADLPDEALVRYDGTVTGLAAAITQLARTDAGSLAVMSAAASAYAASATWHEAAVHTMQGMISVLEQAPATSWRDQATASR